MAVNFIEELRKLLSRAEEDENTEPEGVGEVDPADASDDSTEPQDGTEGEEPEEGSEGSEGEGGSEGDNDGEEPETIPDSEIDAEQLRDELNQAYAKIETYRTRIAELGGDAELDEDEVEAEVDAEVDEDAAYADDEEAAADAEEQRKIIAALRG